MWRNERVSVTCEDAERDNAVSEGANVCGGSAAELFNSEFRRHKHRLSFRSTSVGDFDSLLIAGPDLHSAALLLPQAEALALAPPPTYLHTTTSSSVS